MPRRTRITTTKTKRTLTNNLSASSFLFANQFQVSSQTNPYIGLDMLCKSRKYKTGDGTHEVPIEDDTAKLFQRFLTLCPIKSYCCIERIRIQETGLNIVGNSKVVYDKLDEKYARFVINVRPAITSCVGASVFLGFQGKGGVVTPVQLRNQVATILSPALSPIVIDSSSEVAGRHLTNARSIFIIMDAAMDPKGEFLMSCNLASQDTIGKKQLQDAMKKLVQMKQDTEKEGGDTEGIQGAIAKITTLLNPNSSPSKPEVEKGVEEGNGNEDTSKGSDASKRSNNATFDADMKKMGTQLRAFDFQ
jgi:hypothetical protein